MIPQLSYTIWFSQRTGSTLLCQALESTGIAGRPREWLLGDDLLVRYGASDSVELRERLWEAGSTANGVFGLKFSFYEPHFSRVLAELGRLPGCPEAGNVRADVWHHAFPRCRHIFMTRRNKVRLAVSWWKAIKTAEWHRETGRSSRKIDLTDAYSFEAIDHLCCESVMREAGIQAFFSEAGVVPLTIVYEDFVRDYEGTVLRVLYDLGLDTSGVRVAPPGYQKLADEVSEEWAERFRAERQQGWQNRGW
jgi:LPS sulfotransferase NodH